MNAAVVPPPPDERATPPAPAVSLTLDGRQLGHLVEQAAGLAAARLMDRYPEGDYWWGWIDSKAARSFLAVARKWNDLTAEPGFPVEQDCPGGNLYTKRIWLDLWRCTGWRRGDPIPELTAFTAVATAR